jgi:rSAM/selenodomain-associated transferase 1
MGEKTVGNHAAVTARLCIFTRVPVLGRVKSRLAGALGAAGALQAHVMLVEDTLARLGSVPGLAAELWIDAAPDGRVAEWSERWGLPVRRQSGADLGVRMYGALADCLAAGQSGIVVGTDCPPVDADYVTRAAAALAWHDLVLGPAADGGFGLVGLARPAPGLFADVAWGGAMALGGTLANAMRMRLTTCLLTQIWDVDESADWARWLRERSRPTAQQSPRP